MGLSAASATTDPSAQTISWSWKSTSRYTFLFVYLHVLCQCLWQNNSRLEDRIAAFLQDEKLTGENKCVLLNS